MNELTQKILKKGNPQKKSSRKVGRNKVKCAFYRSSRFRKNKIAKLVKHIAVHPKDSCAENALNKVK